MDVFLFDIDGTLLETGGAGGAALELAMHTAFGVADGVRGVSMQGRTDRGIVQELFERHGIDDHDHHRRLFVDAYLAHLPKTLTQRNGRVLPGVEDLLHQLGRRHNSLVGLLTGNTQRGARIKLTHFGLFDHFVVGGFGDDHPCRNDVARLAARNVAQHLNGTSAAAKLFVIGDTPKDVECARAINACAVAVATGGSSLDALRQSKPDFLLESLEEAEVFLS